MSGELGDPHYYDSIRVNLGLFQHDVNVLWDLAVHDLSILNYLLDDDPVEVYATGANLLKGMPESVAYLTVRFDSGAIAHINVNWLAPVKVRQTLIGCSERMVVYDDLEPSEKIKVYDSGVTLTQNGDQIHEMLVGYRSGDMWAPKLSTKEGLRSQIENVIESVSSGGTPLTSAEMGLRVVELLEAADQSLAANGGPIKVAF